MDIQENEMTGINTNESVQEKTTNESVQERTYEVNGQDCPVCMREFYKGPINGENPSSSPINDHADQVDPVHMICESMHTICLDCTLNMIKADPDKYLKYCPICKQGGVHILLPGKNEPVSEKYRVFKKNIDLVRKASNASLNCIVDESTLAKYAYNIEEFELFNKISENLSDEEKIKMFKLFKWKSPVGSTATTAANNLMRSFMTSLLGAPTGTVLGSNTVGLSGLGGGLSGGLGGLSGIDVQWFNQTD
jgi:hypothetical protein